MAKWVGMGLTSSDAAPRCSVGSTTYLGACFPPNLLLQDVDVAADHEANPGLPGLGLPAGM